MLGEPLSAAGQIIASRYRVEERIGEGGMGVVCRAFDEQLRRSVAIKFLPGVGRSADQLGRFRNEARTLSALSHPNIVTIFEIGHIQDTPFIAMELVEGETLRTRLGAGPMILRDAVDIVLQVARALGAAHDKGIAHRDIKPENVMIRQDGYAKVLDFGVAELRAGDGGTSQMLSGSSFETVAAGVAGTPAYMSPEQIDGRSLDGRSDLFSLGVMLCEMITGTNPFARRGVIETISAIQETPGPAAKLLAAVPPSVSQIVLKLIQRDPALRYQTSALLIADLRKVLGSLELPQSSTGGFARRLVIAVALVTVGGGAAAGAALYQRSERRHWVREVAAPQIATLASHDKAAEAFPLIEEARRYAPDDAELAQAVASATRIATIHSTPPGATVDVKDYLSPEAPWLRLGLTPLDNIRIPIGHLRWRVSKAQIGESITAPLLGDTINFDLAGAASAPDGMVPVGGGPWSDSLAFLGWLGPYQLPPFFIDRYEVTNQQYQQFVAKGGYATSVYWKQPFVRDGRTLTFDEAMELFRDSTSRPGPSTWEGGHYPEGKGDYPVSGVSWFEAAAYAAFVGKSLPVIAQGYKAAPATLDRFVVAESNLSGVPTPVGTFAGLGPYGTFDLIGNVREWYWNGAGADRKYTLGRQANSYGPEALSAFDRSALNGFRCVRNDGQIPPDASAPRPMLQRDFTKAKPISDAEFRIVRTMYAYDHRPLGAKVETTIDTSPDWTRENVSFDSAYGERVTALIFLPKRTNPPYQAVLFFPSARVNFLTDSANPGDMSFIDYVVKSGRAVIYPIYKGFYERGLKTTVLPGPALHRDLLIAWSKDLGRSIDYLESRPDIDKSRIGYLGVSQGSAYGVILTALEPRFKAIVFLDGGMFQEDSPVTGLDQVDFASRQTRPVLMVNGRYDATFPYETSQLPLFQLLGTPAADKRHVVFDTPHDVRLRRDGLVKEVLAWYDKYLGRVN